MPKVPISSSKPVLITFSVLAGLQVLTAGATLSDVIGTKAAGFIMLVVAAVQAGMSFYVHNQVTPWKDVAAKRAPKGRFVSGPAAPTPEGQYVSITEREIHA